MGDKFKRTVYTLHSFLEIEAADWGAKLKAHHLDCMQSDASYSQRKAWFDCYNILQTELSLTKLSTDKKEGSYIVFEYELPRERGRRPDVLILSGNNLLVLEFKGYGKENQAQIDQAKHYARDLRNYHAQSQNLTVVPVLVLAKGINIMRKTEGVIVLSADYLHTIFGDFIKDRFEDINSWFTSDYAPLPSLIQSAQLLFKKDRFPQIKSAQSAGIPTTLEKLLQISIQSKKEGEHHLALITGVPGAGKTLVGLQFVFNTITQQDRQKAVFLSGNGPLVQVLQYSLKNQHFVQSVHGFLKQYAHSHPLPSEDIFIYDEAQRAWDSEKVSESRREGNNAEPTDFIAIGNKKPHLLLIGLIGEGQEIHLGEESGMKLWTNAVKQSAKKWTIHCPQKLKPHFKEQKVEIVEDFNLTHSLRTHQALNLQTWVAFILDNKIQEAATISKKLFQDGYPIYITRNITLAKNYVRKKYEDEPTKTFGILASSKSKILPKYNVKNDFHSTRAINAAQYFVDNTHEAYCRNLSHCVTEFSCQGLELDMPIVAWDTDWVYNNGWQDQTPNNRARDSFKLRKNSYRVLLTRGRDGLIIYIPNHYSLDTTHSVLIEAGCQSLQV